MNARPTKHELYRALRRPPTAKRCYLCRKLLRQGDSTNEHVFPRWLLRQFSLYEQTFSLANDTSLKYSQLRVPCCSACNAQGEKVLETPIARAFQEGYGAVANLPPATLALWCIKIYYGIRLKEHFLPRRRKYQSGHRITARREIDELNLLFLILQGIRLDISFPTEVPWTMWTYRVKVPHSKEEQFSFADIAGVYMFSIRIGDVGIVLLPRDFGLVKNSEFMEYFRYLLDKELHPQQLNEVAARAAYFDIIREIGVSYAIDFSGPGKVIYLGSLSRHTSTIWC